MLKTLNDKLKLMRATRVNMEELNTTMSFLEGGAIKQLKSHLKKYSDDPENETFRLNVDNEVTALIDLADKNRKREDLLHSGIIMQDSNNSAEESKQLEIINTENTEKFGYLGWLNSYMDLNKANDIFM